VTSEIYLDNNATTHLAAPVLAAMLDAMACNFGNPSSEHKSGELARRLIAKARDSVASILRTPSESVIFGSGVTELNYWVMLNAFLSASTSHFVVSTIEHSSVLESAAEFEALGARITRIPVNFDGIVELSVLEQAVKQRPNLVSIQWVNNETGAIQPVKEIAEICANAGVPFHCDAAQAIGKQHIDLSSLAIDYLTASSHKMHGPSGVGCVVVRNRGTLKRLFHGGAQEFGLRPGTENVLGIIGFGSAAKLRAEGLDATLRYIGHLRDRFESTLKNQIPSIKINGSVQHRVCNTSNIMFPGMDGAALVALLDRQGIRCSQTSACVSNRPEPSYVLRAIGLTEDQAYSSVRFSFSNLNTVEEADRAATAVISVVEKLTAISENTTKSTPQRLVGHEV
jgi:cysteine desulfurase